MLKNIENSSTEEERKKLIETELDKAGLKELEIGNFKLKRNWNYWVAISDKNKGLSLSVATELHNKKYVGGEDYNIYGKCIRVNGHCGSPTPESWSMGYDKTIDCYHIDTQEGLNEFVRTVVKSLENKRKYRAVKRDGNIIKDKFREIDIILVEALIPNKDNPEDPECSQCIAYVDNGCIGNKFFNTKNKCWKYPEEIIWVSYEEYLLDKNK